MKRMGRKALALVLCLILVLSVTAGCGKKDTPDSGGEGGGQQGGEDTVKVMILAKNLSDPYSTWLMNMCEQDLKKQSGVEYTILDQQGDPATTESFYDQALLEGYDVVILQKVSGSQNTDDLLQSFANEGLRSVVINNEVTDGVSCNAFYPEYEMGYMIGSVAAENLPQNAKICVLKSTASLFSSEERCRGYLAALESRKDIEILDTQNVEGWSKDIAISVMEDWCQRFDTIDGIISMNDGMALGAIEAAKGDNRDLSSMQFYGIDGLADACLSIEAGELTASVLQDATKMASEGVRLAIELAKNKEMEVEKVELEPVLIQKENIDEFLNMHRENGLIK